MTRSQKRVESPEQPRKSMYQDQVKSRPVTSPICIEPEKSPVVENVHHSFQLRPEAADFNPCHTIPPIPPAETNLEIPDAENLFLIKEDPETVDPAPDPKTSVLDRDWRNRMREDLQENDRAWLRHLSRSAPLGRKLYPNQ